MNVIEFYGFFHDENNFYILIEYATEGSVYNRLKGHSRLEEEIVQPIARGLCDGLSFIHQMGYVHRDIKPENIVLQFVKVYLHREFQKSVTSVGPQAAAVHCANLTAALLYIFRLKWSENNSMDIRSISGLWA